MKQLSIKINKYTGWLKLKTKYRDHKKYKELRELLLKDMIY